MLKGQAGELRELADQLRSIRGVTHGTFSITTIGADLPSLGYIGGRGGCLSEEGLPSPSPNPIPSLLNFS